MASYIIRGLGGTKAVNVDGGDAAVGDILLAAELVDGTVLSFNGNTVSGDTIIPDGSTLVSRPAAAKHG